MLPIELKPLNYREWNQESWEDYVIRVQVPSPEAVRQFYRQVVFDHFEHHNAHYPNFVLEDYEYNIVKFSVKEVEEKFGYFSKKSLVEMWGWQFDGFERKKQGCLIYSEMSRLKTAPFPPVAIESSKLEDESWRIYGRPIHLVEGAHRTSYLLRMAERKIISWGSEHDFVFLTPKPT